MANPVEWLNAAPRSAGLLERRCQFEIAAEGIRKLHLARCATLSLEDGRRRDQNAEAFRS